MGSGDVEFVNPFADESKILSGEDDFDVIYSTREPFSVTDYQRTVAATEIENSDPQRYVHSSCLCLSFVFVNIHLVYSTLLLPTYLSSYVHSPPSF